MALNKLWYSQQDSDDGSTLSSIGWIIIITNIFTLLGELCNQWWPLPILCYIAHPTQGRWPTASSAALVPTPAYGRNRKTLPADVPPHVSSAWQTQAWLHDPCPRWQAQSRLCLGLQGRAQRLHLLWRNFMPVRKAERRKVGKKKSLRINQAIISGSRCNSCTRKTNKSTRG